MRTVAAHPKRLVHSRATSALEEYRQTYGLCFSVSPDQNGFGLARLGGGRSPILQCTKFCELTAIRVSFFLFNERIFVKVAVAK
jgi:hypothetical protein